MKTSLAFYKDDAWRFKNLLLSPEYFYSFTAPKLKVTVKHETY